jgi:hypothetical protein
MAPPLCGSTAMRHNCVYLDLWQELTREQHRAHQDLHQHRLRIDHVQSRVKRWRSVTDRSRLWKVGDRDLVRDLCYALPHAGFV